MSPRSGPRLAPRSPMEGQEAHPPLPSKMAFPAAALPVLVPLLWPARVNATRNTAATIPLGLNTALELLIEAESDDQVAGWNRHHLLPVGQIADGRSEY